MKRRERLHRGLHWALALALCSGLVGGCGGKVSGGPNELNHIDGERGDSGGMSGTGGSTASGGMSGAGGRLGVGGSSSLPCDVGSWDHDANPETECVSWSQCVPGQHIESTGSATFDRACAACPEGSFSSEPNAAECLSWSVCPEGFVETTPGTATSDRVCKDEPWLSQFGTVDVDYVYAIGTDSESNVFVAGSTSGTFPANESSGGTDDAFVRKFDAAGNEVWTRQFGTSAKDVATGLAVDTHGFVIVAGYTIGGALVGTASGGSDAFVRKYDPAGQVVWTRQFGTEKSDNLSGVAVGNNDDVVVVGTTFGSFVNQIGSADAFARKFDSSGNEVWTRQFGSTGSDFGAGVSIDEDGNVLFIGETFGTLPGYVNAGLQDVFVCKYDGAGNELWTRQFGDWGNEQGTGVATDAGGNVIVVGDASGALPGEVGAGDWDVFARKYDPAGNELWTRQVGTSDYDRAAAVTVDDAGNVIVVGYTRGVFPGQVDEGGEYDTFVRKYDDVGSELWTQQFGWSSDNWGAVACTDTDGHIFVAGSTEGALPQQMSWGNYDGFVIRLNE